MTTERFEIVVSETGTKTVQRELEGVGKSSKTAADSVDKLKKALKFNDASTQLAGMSSQAAQMATKIKDLESKVNSLNGSFGILGDVLKTVITAGALKMLQELLDTYTNIQNKLKLVTQNSENLANVNQKIFQTAQQTRQGYGETAELYARIARSSKDLGKSQGDILDVTKAVNQSLVISGASAQEASTSIIQLGQALGSGSLRGDELRSVLENNTRLARAIADGMGISFGQLRAMGAKGALSSKAVFEAIQKEAVKLNAEFEKMSPTIGGSFTTLSNSAIKFIGDFDQANGISRTFAQGIIFLANNFDTLARLAMVAGVALLVAFGPQIIALFSAAASAVGVFTAALLANPIGAIAVGISAALSALFLFSDKIKVSSDGVVTLRDVFGVVFNGIGSLAVSTGDLLKSAWTASLDFVNSRLAKFSSETGTKLQTIGSISKTVANTLIAVFVASYNFIMNNWKKFPGAFGDLIASAANFGIAAFESFVNFAIKALNGLIGKLNGVLSKLPGVKKDLIPEIPGGVKFGRVKVGSTGGDVARGFKAEFQKELSQDYIGDASKAFMDEARKNAQKRLRSQNGNKDLLGPEAPGADVPGADKKGKKGVDRAAELAKINTELDQQIKLLGVEKEKREALQQMNQIENSLRDKKITLDKEERKSIQDKIDMIEKLKKAEEKKEVLKTKNDALDQEIALLRVARKDRESLQQLMQVESQLKQKGISLTETEKKQLTEKIQLVEQLKKTEAKENKIKQETEDLQNQIFVLQQEARDRGILTGVYQFETQLKRENNAATTEEITKRRELLTELRNQEELTKNKDALLQQLVGPQEEYNKKLFALNQLLAEGKISIDQYNLGLSNLQTQLNNSSTTFGAGFQEGLKGLIKSSKDFGSDVAGTIGNAFKGLEDAFVSFVTTGKLDFKSLINSMLADLARLVIRYLIIQPILKGLGGMFGIPMVGSANGNVFEGGSVVKAFANGGVVSSPTFFPMAKGGIGLMGEAGAEAIMPLKRTSSGRLGVETSGGRSGTSVFAPSIVVNVESKGKGDKQDEEMGAAISKQIDDTLKIRMADFIQKEKRPGGMLN